MPSVRKTHENIPHNLDSNGEVLSIIDVMDIEYTRANPTYPKYRDGGWYIRPGSCSNGLSPSACDAKCRLKAKGLDANII